MIARANDDGPTSGEAAGRLENTNRSDLHCDDDERAAQRRIALRASLARRGYVLHKLPDGSWLIARAEGACTLADLHEVEQFLRRVGGAH